MRHTSTSAIRRRHPDRVEHRARRDRRCTRRASCAPRRCSPAKASTNATSAGNAVKSGNCSSSCCAGSTRCADLAALPTEDQRLRAPDDERVRMVGGDADVEGFVRRGAARRRSVPPGARASIGARSRSSAASAGPGLRRSPPRACADRRASSTRASSRRSHARWTWPMYASSGLPTRSLTPTSSVEPVSRCIEVRRVVQCRVRIGERERECVVVARPAAPWRWLLS